MRSVSKNLIQTILIQFPTILFGLVGGIFSARMLGPEGKGVYALLYTNMEILSMLFGFGITLGINYFVASKKLSGQKVAGMSLGTIIFSSILVFALVFLSPNKLNLLFPEGHDALFFRCYLFFSFYMVLVNRIIVAFLNAKLRFKVVNRVTLFSAGLSMVILTTTFVLKDSMGWSIGIQEILALGLVTFFINHLIWIWCYLSFVRIRPEVFGISRSDIYSFYSYTTLGFLGGLINFFNYRLDVWMVSSYEDEEQLGYYSLAVNVAQFMMVISRTMGSVIMPYLSGDNEAIRRKNYILFAKLNTVITILALVFMFIGGDFLIYKAYGREFVYSISPFFILVIAMFFTCISQLQSVFFSANKMNRYGLYASLWGLATTLSLNLWLIPLIGIDGAAYSTLGSYLVYFLYLYIIHSYKIEGRLVNIFIPVRSDIPRFRELLKRNKLNT